MLIYKILLPAEWATFSAAGRFDGSPLDLRSGFVHCSNRAQVGGVAEGLFADEPELVVVALDAEALASSVRWEDAPDGGGRYPHVYGPLPVDAVVAVHRVRGASSVERELPAG